MGYAVKFVSVTNGDAGHHVEGGGALASRRAAEAAEAGKRLGVVYDVVIVDLLSLNQPTQGTMNDAIFNYNLVTLYLAHVFNFDL